MKAAHAIAQRIFDNGTRFHSESDNGALLLMPEHMQRYAVATWHTELQHDVEVTVNAQQVKTLGPEQAWFDAAFADMQRGEFAGEVDQALWLIQCEYLREKRAESRGRAA